MDSLVRPANPHPHHPTTPTPRAPAPSGAGRGQELPGLGDNDSWSGPGGPEKTLPVGGPVSTIHHDFETLRLRADVVEKTDHHPAAHVPPGVVGAAALAFTGLGARCIARLRGGAGGGRAGGGRGGDGGPCGAPAVKIDLAQGGAVCAAHLRAWMLCVGCGAVWDGVMITRAHVGCACGCDAVAISGRAAMALKPDMAARRGGVAGLRTDLGADIPLWKGGQGRPDYAPAPTHAVPATVASL